MALRALPGMAVTDPALDGPYPAVRTNESIPGTQGANLATDVYFPGTQGAVDPAAGRCPVVVLGHGFLQSKNNHVNQGLHLATRGYIVLIPNSNEASNHSRYADDLIKSIDWITERNVDAASPFFGRVRTDRIGATGHSAGGLSAILAASRDPRIKALAPMDPVDNGGLGLAALASVAAPVAVTYSEPSACNASGSAADLYDAASAPRRGIRIVGANHSDAQDPASFTGILFCGAPDGTRQALYRRYTTGWFEYHLRDDARYGPWVFNQPGGNLEADRLAGRITYTDEAAPSAAWRHVHFGAEAFDPLLAGDDADPDHDGLPNLLEYAFNTDPRTPDNGPALFLSLITVDGASHPALTFPLVTAASDITYRFESAASLSGWTPGCSYTGSTRVTETPTSIEMFSTGSGLETVTVRDKAPVTPGPRFLRLKVER